MFQIRTSPEADNDLVNIWLFGLNTWGEAQADHYSDLMEKGISILSNNSKSGIACDYIRSGYRSLLVERHVVYYQINGSFIDVIRVLQERKHPSNHL